MNAKKDYIVVSIFYFLVILYVIFFNNVFVTALLILALLIYHIVTFIGTKEKLNKDKEVSLSKLLSKIDKTKRENENAYKRFISLTTTLGNGVIMVDKAGIINFTNKDFIQYFDTDATSKDYKSLSNIKPLYKFIDQAYLMDKSYRKQIHYKDQFFDLVSTPFFQNDLFQGCLIIVHDITLLKTAGSFQKQFTADVSHELKTPLSTIKGFSEILARDTDMNKDDRVEFISLIKKESIRMETILSDLLIISKMDRLDYELSLEKTNIKNVIMDNLDSLQHHINTKDLVLNTDIEDCDLEIDKNKMGQVILNLVKNSINYTDSGEINVYGKTINSQYSIKVKDTGIGIIKEELEKIFKRFYRVDSARSRDTGGSGLGLSICKNVVLKHGGTISVDSVRNEGTTFEIRLPIKK